MTWNATRDALAETSARFSGLLRSVADAQAPAVGDWTIGDTAAHVHEVSVLNSLFATGAGAPLEWREVYDRALTVDIDSVNQINALSLAAQEERDPAVLSRRIGGRVELLLDETAGSDGTERVSWLGGLKLPVSAVLAHMLSELLVHGGDIARAEGRAFPLSSAHAVLLFEGFLMDLLAGAEEAGFAGQRTAGVGDVCCDLRLRGCERVLLVVEDEHASIEAPGTRTPDVHISADPAAMWLLMFSRRRPLAAALRGQVVVWGRRPWKLRPLMTMMKFP